MSNETTSFVLTGSTLAIVSQLASDEGVTLAQALTLIIDQAGDPVSRGTLLGGESGKEMLGDLWTGPSGQLPARLVRNVTTDDVGEASDLIWEVRRAWDATTGAEDGGFAGYEHEETSHALDELEQVTEGVSDGHDLTWELTFPNGDELHLHLTV